MPIIINAKEWDKIKRELSPKMRKELEKKITEKDLYAPKNRGILINATGERIKMEGDFSPAHFRKMIGNKIEIVATKNAEQMLVCAYCQEACAPHRLNVTATKLYAGEKFNQIFGDVVVIEQGFEIE